jgi:5-oxoprolinase (ATP-hydrolysing)
VTVAGAKQNYGVVVDPIDFSVKKADTEALRAEMAKVEDGGGAYNRGGDLETLQRNCLAETGLPPPKRQWDLEPYGPHVGLEYVREWYREMREKGDGGWRGLH